MYTGNSISESVKKAKYVGLKEGYDYIATKDVTFEHTIEYDNGVRIPVNDDFKIAYGGSVLMCIEGGSAGRKIGILDRNVCFGNKLCSFNSAEIVNTYIYYYLQSHEFKAFFMDNISMSYDITHCPNIHTFFVRSPFNTQECIKNAADSTIWGLA